MSKTLKRIFDKVVPFELDKPRKLMLTTYAWMFLEEQYGSVAGAMRAYAELQSGYRQVTHVTNWLYALVQEEIRQANKDRKPNQQESITREDMESIVKLDRVLEYRSVIADVILTYYPAPDPLKPTPAGTGESGSGSQSENSSPASTGGTTSDT